MTSDELAASLQSGPHHFLSQLTGDWEGMTRTYFEPDILADESRWKGSIRPMLNGLFVRHDYSGSLQGKPLNGSAVYGYQIASNKFQCAWVDSFHNGTSMMFCEGSTGSDSFNVLGKYDAPDGSPPWGWRTVIEIISNDELIITMFNITPEGVEAKAVVTNYRRAYGGS